MLLMLAGALAELVTIGAVVPFISLMAQPGRAYDFPLLQTGFEAIGWDQSQSILLPMTVLFLAIVLLSTGTRLLLTYVSTRFIFALGYDVGVKLYSTILNQPYAYHISKNTSEVLAGINKVQIMVNAVLRPLMEALTAVVLAVGILAALIIVDAATAIVAGLLFGAIYLVVMKMIRLKLAQNGKIIAATQSTRIRCVQEGLGGIRDVILDGSQSHYVKVFSRVDQQFRKAQATNVFIGSAPRFLIEAIGIVLIIGLAYSLSLQPGGLLGALPVLGALALGAQRLLPLLQKIFMAWAQVMGNRQIFVDVLSMLNLPFRKLGITSKLQPLRFERAISIRNLSFGYAPDESPVLRAIDIEIPKGSRVGIIGKTGSGKTTITDILMGLLDPNSGMVLVDGTPLGPDNRRTWQDMIAHVPQHIYLADASVAENIALGVPLENIDMHRVRKAARQAQIADFIEASRLGYDTCVGERGVQLSGGQRQRIGIARALYKEADVLVFDEASSALDTETETAVMQAVSQLDPNLTLFIIAHRVQTLRECDLILRLEDGRLVASGSYEEVIGAQPRQAAADSRN